MLREQVFAVELISLAISAALRTGRATIILQAQVLGGYVTLPLVLGPERACTAGKGERTRERPRVSSCDMFAERRQVLEWGMATVATPRLLLRHLFLKWPPPCCTPWALSGDLAVDHPKLGTRGAIRDTTVVNLIHDGVIHIGGTGIFRVPDCNTITNPVALGVEVAQHL